MQRNPAEECFTHALQAVLDYLWDDEAADYGSRSPQEKRGHIFAQLKTLQAWLCTPKKMLDKSYHTVARRCLQSLPLTSQLLASSLVEAFTKSLCAFAAGMRLPQRTVRTTTCVANTRGRA
jgi:hypothetical protein